MIRRLSTTCATFAKIRPHARSPRVKVPPPQPRVTKPAPTSTPTSTATPAPRVTRSQWDVRQLTHPSPPDPRFIPQLLERIISYSDQSVFENLSEHRQDTLCKLVQSYDYSTGGEMMNIPELQETLKICREKEDWVNLLRVYDTIFPQIINGMLIQYSQEREELRRGMGTNFEDVEIESLEKINNGEIVDVEKSLWDVEERVKIEKVIEEIVKEWYNLERPRNLRIMYTSLDDLVRILKDERILMRFDGKFVDDFISDLVISGMFLEWNEVEVMIKNVLRFQHLNRELYNVLKGEIIKLKGGMNADIYRILMEGAIRNQEYQLCEIIMNDFSQDGFMLDRGMIRIALRWISMSEEEVKNREKRLLAMLKFIVEESEMVLFSEEWQLIVDGFIRVGRRDIALDIVKALLIVDNGRSVEKERNIKLNDEVGTFDVMNSSCKAFAGEIICSRENLSSEVVETILVTSANVEEWRQLTELFEESLGDAMKSAELCKIELIVHTQWGLYDGKSGRERFAASVERVLALPLTEVDRFVQDGGCVAAVVGAAERFVDTVAEAEGEGEADTVVAAYGALLQVAERGEVADKAAVLRHVLALAEG